MTRQDYNRTFGLAPVVMSLMALALVVMAAIAGWQTSLPDEGLAANAFQLLTFTQPVLVVLFLATADWRRPLRVTGFLALQALGAGLAFGALFYLESSGLQA